MVFVRFQSVNFLNDDQQQRVRDTDCGTLRNIRRQETANQLADTLARIRRTDCTEEVECLLSHRLQYHLPDEDGWASSNEEVAMQ